LFSARKPITLDEMTLYIEDAFGDIDGNRQLCERECASVPERL
jgi:hypothetical protein